MVSIISSAELTLLALLLFITAFLVFNSDMITLMPAAFRNKKTGVIEF